MGILELLDLVSSVKWFQATTSKSWGTATCLLRRLHPSIFLTACPVQVPGEYNNHRLSHPHLQPIWKINPTSIILGWGSWPEYLEETHTESWREGSNQEPSCNELQYHTAFCRYSLLKNPVPIELNWILHYIQLKKKSMTRLVVWVTVCTTLLSLGTTRNNK